MLPACMIAWDSLHTFIVQAVQTDKLCVLYLKVITLFVWQWLGNYCDSLFCTIIHKRSLQFNAVLYTAQNNYVGCEVFYVGTNPSPTFPGYRLILIRRNTPLEICRWFPQILFILLTRLNIIIKIFFEEDKSYGAFFTAQNCIFWGVWEW